MVEVVDVGYRVAVLLKLLCVYLAVVFAHTIGIGIGVGVGDGGIQGGRVSYEGLHGCNGSGELLIIFLCGVIVGNGLAGMVHLSEQGVASLLQTRRVRVLRVFLVQYGRIHLEFGDSVIDFTIVGRVAIGVVDVEAYISIGFSHIDTVGVSVDDGAFAGQIDRFNLYPRFFGIVAGINSQSYGTTVLSVVVESAL